MEDNTNPGTTTLGGKVGAIGKPGPFQIIEALGSGEVELPIDPPRRRYECTNYDTCLELAAALNWDNFTCRGCSAEISQPLLWRAHQARRKDSVAGTLCEHLPEIGIHSSDKSFSAPVAKTDEPAVSRSGASSTVSVAEKIDLEA